MQVIESINEMQALAVSLRSSGKLIGFVPTMGFLHEGHLSLIDIAKGQVDKVVVSIYVNPTQFSPNEDFERYPRDMEKDLQLCEERGVDIIFAPTTNALYPEGYSTYVNEERLSAGLCGLSRPSFFRGVCTIVAKLFNIVRPDVAVFGQKDAQQVAVIKKMVEDMHFPVDVLTGPTVRESDGLAMSSRNAYMDEYQRKDACQIYQSLQAGKNLFENGITSASEIQEAVATNLTRNLRLRIIYVSVAHKDTMEPLQEVIPGQTLIAVAVWCDNVRLIDNIVI